MNYNYPLRDDWSTAEIIIVSDFYNVIEKAHEDGVSREHILTAYKKFKKVVPSKGEEKALFREFERASSYKSYQIVRAASTETTEIIKAK